MYECNVCNKTYSVRFGKKRAVVSVDFVDDDSSQQELSVFSDVLNPALNRDAYIMIDDDIKKELLTVHGRVEIAIN